jgi:hypothetical protein
VTVTHVIWTLEEKDVEKKGGNILDKNKWNRILEYEILDCIKVTKHHAVKA